MRTRWLELVRGRIERFNAGRDAATVLCDEAVDEVLALICSVPDPLEDIEVAQAAGWLYWLRFAARASMEGESDALTAIDLLAPVYRLSPAFVPDLISEQFRRETPDAPDGAALLARLGRLRFQEAYGSRDAARLDQAIDLLENACAATEPDHREYCRSRSNLGSALLTRFEWNRSWADLDEAIEMCEEAVVSTASGEPQLAAYLGNLGNALLTRFEHLGGEADLELAIEAAQAAVDGWPDHPEHDAMAANLDLALRTRSAYLDRMAELDGAIEAAREQAGPAPSEQSAQAAALSDLSSTLLTRYDISADPADLDEAVRACRDAVAAAAPGDPLRGACLCELSNLLRIRFIHVGEETDLAEAVAAARAGVAATAADDDDLPWRQHNLSIALIQLYQRTGDRQALDEAIALSRESSAAVSADDEGRASVLSGLCDGLRLRFESTGWEADLDEAIDAGRAAVAAATSGQLYLAAYLGNLGAALLARFRHGAGQPDLDEAIDALRKAVFAAPPASPDRGTVLANLGGGLLIRFNSLNDPRDLDEAIDACRKGVLATPRGHSSRAARLSNFCAALQTRFALTGVAADIEEAVAASQVAVDEMPADHPRRAAVLSNHALVLRAQREHGEDASDLDEQVEAARGAVAATKPDHPDRAGFLFNLGRALHGRFASTGAQTDWNEALTAFQQATAVKTAPPRITAAAAGAWGSIAAQSERWQEAVAGFAAAVDLAARAVPRSLARPDQELLLAGMGGVGSDAAACCVQAGLVDYGIELFEQGRGLLLGQALDSRTDLSALTELYPETAGRFAALCAELDRPGLTQAVAVAPAVAPGDDALRANRIPVTRRAAAAELDRLLEQIRQLPGFEGFLAPPAVRDLTPAQGHVVIVNESRFGSHALILAADGDATAVPLPMLTPDAVLTEVQAFLNAIDDVASRQARTRAAGQHRIEQTLGWLWDAVAGPVLDRLGITGPPANGRPWPRLWWCPSGLMSFLPLHAAGRHDPSPGAVPDTVIDRVVCSVTPTLRALAHARRRDEDAASAQTGTVHVGAHSDQAVVIAMPYTPGTGSDLPGAQVEAAVLRNHFPGAVSVLTGSAVTHEAVLAALPKARWAHFACHAYSDPDDPSSSHLLLADHQTRPLTVVDLARLRMEGAELAFLSACETARPSARLVDEAIHLASAFQLAGYRHVIGTLWPIGDQHAVEVAELIYTAVDAVGDIAMAVQIAALQMRERWPNHPSVWASHVHVGP